MEIRAIIIKNARDKQQLRLLVESNRKVAIVAVATATLFGCARGDIASLQHEDGRVLDNSLTIAEAGVAVGETLELLLTGTTV